MIRDFILKLILNLIKMKKNLFSFPRSKVRMLKGSKGVWLFLIMFWMINTAASAAGIEIKGTVTDSKGEPLPGVNIVELGVKKNNGTISDLMVNIL